MAETQATGQMQEATPGQQRPLTLTPTQFTQLQSAYRGAIQSNPAGIRSHRLSVIMLLGRSWTINQVADFYGIPPATVTAYANAWQAHPGDLDALAGLTLPTGQRDF